MAFARQLFKGVLKKDKVYPWTLAKLVKAQGGETLQKYLDICGWGAKTTPPYTSNCLSFGGDDCNVLQFYNKDSTNKPPNSDAGIIQKFFISGNAYAAIAYDLTNMKIFYIGYSVKDKTWHGWFTFDSAHNHDNRYYTEIEINNLFNTKLAKFKSITLHNITVNPAGKNYFDINRNTNQFIVPAHVHTQILDKVQYGQTSVRILLRDACSTNIGFYYLIVTV